MKKLTINKMNEYPTINLDEQMTIKGGTSPSPWLDLLIWAVTTFMSSDSSNKDKVGSPTNGDQNNSVSNGIINTTIQKIIKTGEASYGNTSIRAYGADSIIVDRNGNKRIYNADSLIIGM